jgi:glycogen debranching enzyme
MEDLTIKAFNLLLSNKKQGYSTHFKRNYLYFSPDEIHYHQWFWDSCFHAIVMANFKVKLAIKEIETLLSCQTENGFVPHIIFWKWRLIDVVHYLKSWKKEMHPQYRFFTAEIQPPVIGITLEKIYETTKSMKFLEKYLPPVGKYFDYLSRERDRDGNHLISIVTPMESGMDMAPHFDLVFGNPENNPAVTKGKISKMLSEYRRVHWQLDDIYALDIFNFEDVAVNTIYCLSLEKLARLWELIDRTKSNEIRQLYERAKRAILEKLWDAGDKIFYGRYHKDGKEYMVKIKTIASLFPLCLDIPTEYVDSLVQHLCNEDEFWLTYPVPSVARDEQSFGPLTNTRYIWRGTTWINTNWFLAKGLLRHGKTDVYEKLKERTRELIEKHGFCEYYDPFTGNPGQAMRNFGWSTLAVDM